MSKICGIYKITSKLYPDRCYVGSANDILGRRWNGHYRLLFRNKHHSIFLQNHYNKHGIDDLILEIIEEVDINMGKKYLLSREKFYMNKFRFKNTNKPYFNVNPEPSSCKGAKHSPKANKEKSERQMGKKRAPFTEEHRRNLSLSHKNLPFIRRKQHYVKGQESAFKGKHHTEKANQMNREKHLGTGERCRRGALKRVRSGKMPPRDSKGRFIKR